MTTNEFAALGMIGFVTIWTLAGYISLRMACRGQRPTPDWNETWEL